MTATTTLPYEVVSADTTQITRDEWLQLRKQGLGSSDVAGVLGMSPYCSPYSVFCDKRQLVPEHEQSEFFSWKLALEPVVLDWVERKEWVHGPIRRHMMLRSVEYPFLLSNPDGFTDREVVEVKSMHSMDEHRWESGAPDWYTIQVHVHMIVTGLRECLIPVIFGSDPPREFWFQYEPELAELIIARCGEFWQQVQDGIEPDADASEATMTALRERYYESEVGTSVTLDATALDLVRLRNTALEIVKANEEIIDGCKTSLMSKMGTHEVAIVPGYKPIATWKTSEKTGNRTFLFKDIRESA